MVLTKEEIDLLTRVGPGTAGGELLRRYWLPIAVAEDLTAEQPTQFVRVLGEDLVLFRLPTGDVGLLADKCAHRGVSLCYGRVEERGISCAYHGWLYARNGEILETPPERNDAVVRTVRQTSYPVQKFIGMYWAYLGPSPAPLIAPYDLWVRQDGQRRVVVQPRLDCNWFQAMENSVDPAHLQILHQETAFGGKQPESTTRGFTDDVVDYDFEVTDIGIVKRRTYLSGHVEEHPILFPNILRQGNCTQIRSPMDDTHTRIFFVRFDALQDGARADDEHIKVQYEPSYKNPLDALHPAARFRWDAVQAQDHMAWETQGPVADRTHEHLSYSDRGVALLRKLMFEQIERVRAGGEPLGVIRDPNHPIIDTNLEGTLEELRVGGAHNVPSEPILEAVSAG